MNKIEEKTIQDESSMDDAASEAAIPKGNKQRTPIKKGLKKSSKPKDKQPARTRTARPYPASSFMDALALGEAIMKHAAGEKVRRLTLLGKMDKSPTSSTTQMMITNSGKYGITSGSYIADFLELTDMGKRAVDVTLGQKNRTQAQFQLAIEGIAPFKSLYDHYKDKRLPERDVIRDFLKDSGAQVGDLDECVDTFTVNVKDLGLLKTIGGAETLTSIEQTIDELPNEKAVPPSNTKGIAFVSDPILENDGARDWSKICFYITPIGAEESEERKHSDLFLASLVQPALEELGLVVVRADQIGEPGMITSQVLEYIRRSKLTIADLSYLNPNVFYEVALRHALKLPVVQLIRKADKLPFDVNQARTLVFDTTDIYSLVPKLQTYRAEIANQARKAIEDPESVGNPITVFFPAFYK